MKLHYGDVIWAPWCFNSLSTRLFSSTKNNDKKENIIAPAVYWSSQRVSNAESIPMSLSLHVWDTSWDFECWRALVYFLIFRCHSRWILLNHVIRGWFVVSRNIYENGIMTSLKKKPENCCSTCSVSQNWGPVTHIFVCQMGQHRFM